MPSLNPAQHEAVEHDTGPMLVLAGAGSGKTRVVTARIARLLERGVPSRSILAVTFTNKAAEEMHERVERAGRDRSSPRTSWSRRSTASAFACSAEARALGLRNGQFTIFDQGDAAGAVREILRGVRGEQPLRRVGHPRRASRTPRTLLWRRRASLPEREGGRLRRDRRSSFTRSTTPRSAASQAFDFDDLVCEPVRLLQATARRARALAGAVPLRPGRRVPGHEPRAARARAALVRASTGTSCVVGDDDQSIYAWRGADVRNILDFEKHFPGAKVVKLEQNYRSTSAVLSVANSVLARTSAKRHTKVLRADPRRRHHRQHGRRRGRGARGGVRGRRDQAAPRRRAGAQRHRRPLPLEPAGRTHRVGAERARDRRASARRHAVLRSQGGERPSRVPARRAESPRRDRPAAGDQLSGAPDRRRRARKAGERRQHVEENDLRFRLLRGDARFDAPVGRGLSRFRLGDRTSPRRDRPRTRRPPRSRGRSAPTSACATTSSTVRRRTSRQRGAGAMSKRCFASSSGTTSATEARARASWASSFGT